MSRALAALAAVPVLLASACGGGKPAPRADVPSPSPSITVSGLISASAAVPVDYLTRADADCATSLGLLRKRGPAPIGPSDPRKLTGKQLRAAAAYLQAGAAIQIKAAQSLDRLAPPPAGADEWAVFVAAAGRYAAGTQAEAAAAKAGDVSQFLTAAARLLGLRTKVLDSGLAVGLGAGTACARLF